MGRGADLGAAEGQNAGDGLDGEGAVAPDVAVSFDRPYGKYSQIYENPQSIEVRQNIANIGVFVMNQTVEMQLNPDPAKLKSLIDINCNLAAGLSGRG